MWLPSLQQNDFKYQLTPHNKHIHSARQHRNGCINWSCCEECPKITEYSWLSFYKKHDGLYTILKAEGGLFVIASEWTLHWSDIQMRQLVVLRFSCIPDKNNTMNWHVLQGSIGSRMSTRLLFTLTCKTSCKLS